MKVAIIGAGINGLYLAKKLAEKNHQVTIFEKRGVIGKIACSGLFSERIFDFFPESKTLVQNIINYGLIHFPKRDFKLNFSKKFFVISHYELDNFVAKQVKSGGVEIILNQEIKENNFPELEKIFDRIIGSDGPNSQTRKYLKGKNPEIKLGIQGFVKTAGDWDFFETWPTRSGLLWKIPRGDEVEYGVLEKSPNAKNIFDNFLKEKNIQIELSPSGQVLSATSQLSKRQKMESAIIPHGLSISCNEKIALSGDAAGFVKPWSGGGVIWGLLAADMLLADFPDFTRYKKRAGKFFSKKILISKIISRAGYFLGNNAPWILPREKRIESDFLISF